MRRFKENFLLRKWGKLYNNKDFKGAANIENFIPKKKTIAGLEISTEPIPRVCPTQALVPSISHSKIFNADRSTLHGGVLQRGLGMFSIAQLHKAYLGHPGRNHLHRFEVPKLLHSVADNLPSVVDGQLKIRSIF